VGQRKYPPLKPREIINILIARGFSLLRTRGDHQYFGRTVKGKKKMTHVDMGAGEYGSRLIKQVIKQSGMDRKQFYASTKTCAKKINVKPATKEELDEWAD